MNETRRIPKLRFPEFTDIWEQRRLGEIVYLFDERTTSENEYPVLSSTMSGIYLQNDYFNQEISKISNVGYKIVPYGYITYRSMSDTNIFRFNVQNIIEKGIVSPAYPVINGYMNLANNMFLIYEMNNCSSFLNQILWTKEGGTRYALSYKKLSELYVIIPSIKEQLKITEIFTLFDNLIALHQRKLENLKKQKKSLLQKMFPKNGEQFPELRFPNFTDALGTAETGGGI